MCDGCAGMCHLCRRVSTQCSRHTYKASKRGDQLLLAASQLCGFVESGIIPTQGGIQIDWITEGKT